MKDPAYWDTTPADCASLLTSTDLAQHHLVLAKEALGYERLKEGEEHLRHALWELEDALNGNDD